MSTATRRVTPKVAVFDLGKVLVDFDWQMGLRRMVARSTVTAEALLKLFDYSPPLIQFELGQLSKEQFFEEARRRIGFAGSYAEFDEAFSDIFVEIPAMIELHAALRRRGVPTCIFSNTNELHFDHIRRRFPFFSQFDRYVVSFRSGAMKPDPAIYEVVESETGRRGAEILYLDDRAENVAAGVARGWQALQHTAPETTREFVQRLGLLG